MPDEPKRDKSDHLLSQLLAEAGTDVLPEEPEVDEEPAHGPGRSQDVFNKDNYADAKGDTVKELVQQFVPLAKALVRKRIKRIQNPDQEQEYFQIALFALVRAAQQFDPSRGVKFMSYAYRAIDNSLIDAGSRDYEISNAEVHIGGQTGDGGGGDEETPEDTQDEFGDQGAAAGEIDRDLNRKEAHTLLKTVIAELPDQQKQVITMSIEGMNNVQIAKKLGVTPMRITQIMQAVLARMKVKMGEKGFGREDFLENLNFFSMMSGELSETLLEQNIQALRDFMQEGRLFPDDERQVNIHFVGQEDNFGCTVFLHTNDNRSVINNDDDFEISKVIAGEEAQYFDIAPGTDLTQLYMEQPESVKDDVDQQIWDQINDEAAERKARRRYRGDDDPF